MTLCPCGTPLTSRTHVDCIGIGEARLAVRAHIHLANTSSWLSIPLVLSAGFGRGSVWPGVGRPGSEAELVNAAAHARLSGLKPARLPFAGGVGEFGTPCERMQVRGRRGSFYS